MHIRALPCSSVRGDGGDDGGGDVDEDDDDDDGDFVEDG